MDVIFGFVGDKFAVVVSDTMAVQQIIINKDDEDKTLQLREHLCRGLLLRLAGGPSVVAGIVSTCKIRDVRGDPKAEQPTKRSIVIFAFQPLTKIKVEQFEDIAAVLRLKERVVSYFKFTPQCEVCSGPAPPGALERAVQRDLRKSGRQ